MQSEAPTLDAESIKRELSDLYPYWHSPIDLGHGINTKPGRAERRFRRRLELLQIPTDLKGKRVLDVGTWDGYFALELERRGAQVHAIDLWNDNALNQFQFVLKAKNSKITHSRLDVHDLTPEKFGLFDIVLCAGVLYHTRHPLLVLERLRSVTKELLILETVTMIPAVHANSPMIMLFPGDQKVFADARAGKSSLRWGISGAATLPWIRRALITAGFNRVEHKYRPSFQWWKRLVALFTNTPGGGRSVTHAYVV